MRKLTIILLTVLSLNAQAQLSEQERFHIAKNLDIFNALFKELNLFYVDSIDSDKTIRNNINYMLRGLDPYTEFIPEEEMTDFLQMTTGEYGGVGAIITSRADQDGVYVAEPYEGMPAQLAGMQAGDQLLEIDGVSLAGKNSSFASERLRGEPRTTLTVKFLRPGEKRPREVKIERKRVEIDPVVYYGVLKDGTTGYIHLSRFTTHSAQNIRVALADLTGRKISSLILDVRNNEGGVVEDCLEILNLFIPKGELLLTMKGKVPQMDRTYRSTQEALYPDLPLCVLVNHASASAAEILAGAVQDLDRGVVVGSRTFGKGLVQSPRELPYNARLKLTTAKYYIPSGRCIQAIDYSLRQQGSRERVIPDSLTSVFYTANGRPVKDGGGVAPDLAIDEKDMPNIIYYMDAQNIFFDFVVQWRINHRQIAPPEEFLLTDEDYREFCEFVKSKDFNYDRQSEKAMKSLKEIMEFEGYMDGASAEFEALENKLKPDLDRDLELYRAELSLFLSMQIMKQYYFAKGEQVYFLQQDKVLKKAQEVLADPEGYRNVLNPEKAEETAHR